jgi:general secretion pathway protein C
MVLAIFALSAEPAAAQWRGKEPDAIVARNIFCSGCISSPPGEPAPSPLALELVSTMICPTDEPWSMAVLRDLSTREKDPILYRRGDLLAGGAILVKVERRRVTLLDRGRLEYVELTRATATQPEIPPPLAADRLVSCSGGSCTVERALVEEVLRNPAKLSAVRVAPAFGQGRSHGLALHAIRRDSIFARIGLEDGDTLQSINGVELRSLDDAVAAYARRRNASHLSVQLERRDQRVTLDCSIR